jgi:hypothetical protein
MLFTVSTTLGQNRFLRGEVPAIIHVRQTGCLRKFGPKEICIKVINQLLNTHGFLQL